MSFEVMSLQQDLSKSSADAPNQSAPKKKSKATSMDSCAEKDAQREWQKRQNPQSVPPKKTETGSTVTYSETDSVCTSNNKRVLQ
jgi:hypothetical protein